MKKTQKKEPFFLLFYFSFTLTKVPKTKVTKQNRKKNIKRWNYSWKEQNIYDEITYLLSCKRNLACNLTFAWHESCLPVFSMSVYQCFSGLPFTCFAVSVLVVDDDDDDDIMKNFFFFDGRWIIRFSNWQVLFVYKDE